MGRLSAQRRARRQPVGAPREGEAESADGQPLRGAARRVRTDGRAAQVGQLGTGRSRAGHEAHGVSAERRSRGVSSALLRERQQSWRNATQGQECQQGSGETGSLSDGQEFHHHVLSPHSDKSRNVALRRQRGGDASVCDGSEEPRGLSHAARIHGPSCPASAGELGAVHICSNVDGCHCCGRGSTRGLAGGPRHGHGAHSHLHGADQLEHAEGDLPSHGGVAVLRDAR
mmetsp:Transcript_12961/g.48035  ORF Transcript_12961/g.48035 Transcript_12961/m.48035 type:complete len:229 (-) Transcript_12961:1156-1842(-)